MSFDQNPWHPINEVPPDSALIVVYVNVDHCKFAFCTGNELPGMLIEYPVASAWKVVTEAPTM